MTSFPRHLKPTVLHNGLLLVDKPEGWETAEVVAAVKRSTGAGKVINVGHLDTKASGLLLLCFGDAARLSNTVERTVKVYEGSLLLGCTTNSYDAAGQGLQELPWRHLTDEDLRLAASGMVGGGMALMAPRVRLQRLPGAAGQYVEEAEEAYPAYPFSVDISEFTVQRLRDEPWDTGDATGGNDSASASGSRSRSGSLGVSAIMDTSGITDGNDSASSSAEARKGCSAAEGPGLADAAHAPAQGAGGAMQQRELAARTPRAPSHAAAGGSGGGAAAEPSGSAPAPEAAPIHGTQQAFHPASGPPAAPPPAGGSLAPRPHAGSSSGDGRGGGGGREGGAAGLRAAFRLALSGRAYVRSLVHMYGQRLRSGAVLESLRRTRVGTFDVEDAWALEALLPLLQRYSR